MIVTITRLRLAVWYCEEHAVERGVVLREEAV